MNKRLARKRHRVERLESRHLLAGNVAVVVNGEDLIITGDDSDNDFEIIQGATDDEFIINGFNGTTINGMDSFTAMGVDDDATIKLRGGNDFVRMKQVTLPDNLRVFTGGGDNIVQLSNSEVGDDMLVFGHRGDNVVIVESSLVGDDLEIRTKTGDDTVLVDASLIDDLTKAYTSGGNDSVGLIGTDFRDRAILRLSGGDDRASVENSIFRQQSNFSGGSGAGDELTEDVALINTFEGTNRSQQFEGDLDRIADTHFSYDGATGPDFWGGLTPAFIRASAGHSQSPIDIATADTAQGDLPNIAFDYHAEQDLKYFHTGETIEVEFHAGNKITLDGIDFELLQFHFHTSSEHTVDGQPFAGELHLVHRDANGMLAVVGVLLNAGPPANIAYNGLVNPLNLPNMSDTKDSSTKTVDINPADLLPADRSYYRYSGSLTTPPATEMVNWIVMTTPVQVSQAQINAIANAINPAHGNNRPVQPLNGRTVAEDTSP